MRIVRDNHNLQCTAASIYRAAKNAANATTISKEKTEIVYKIDAKVPVFLIIVIC